MYLTQINTIRGLTKAEYFQLRELCFFSNCLYNFALYNVRQKFFKDKIYLRFEANYHECKDNDNYKLLQANMAQQTLRTVDFAFKSFFGSLGKVKCASAALPQKRRLVQLNYRRQFNQYSRRLFDRAAKPNLFKRAEQSQNQNQSS